MLNLRAFFCFRKQLVKTTVIDNRTIVIDYTSIAKIPNNKK